MGLHDFICTACREQTEVYYPASGVENEIACQCGGVSVRVLLKAPGIACDIEPAFDVQLGRYVGSRQERERLLKERGLIALGPDELRRTESQSHTEEPKIDTKRFRDAAMKALNDLKYQNVPREEAVASPVDADGNCDV